jgi:hypothetical protein
MASATRDRSSGWMAWTTEASGLLATWSGSSEKMRARLASPEKRSAWMSHDQVPMAPAARAASMRERMSVRSSSVRRRSVTSRAVPNHSAMLPRSSRIGAAREWVQPVEPSGRMTRCSSSKSERVRTARSMAWRMRSCSSARDVALEPVAQSGTAALAMRSRPSMGCISDQSGLMRYTTSSRGGDEGAVAFLAGAEVGASRFSRSVMSRVEPATASTAPSSADDGHERCTRTAACPRRR